MEQTDQTQYVKATWGIALKIWWWIIWRSLLTAMAGGFIIGFVAGFVMAIAGINSDTIQTVAAVLGAIVGVVVNVFFIKKVIGKKFKDVTLVLLKAGQPSLPGQQ